MTGARGQAAALSNRVENMALTPGFDAVYQRNLEALGETMSPPEQKGGKCSRDVGNVSQVVPTIQPSISITDVPTPGHSEGFRAAACSEKGLRSIALGAKALALTALDLLESLELLDSVKKEHSQALRAQLQE